MTAICFHVRDEVMRFREPFIVFPRKLPSGKIIYYFQTYTEDGTRTNPRSTGQTSRTAAKNQCCRWLKEGKLLSGSVTLFRDYVKDWYVYDKCPYIRSRILRGGDFSRSYADACRQRLNEKLLPDFGNTALNRIKPAHIESWLQGLKNGGLSNTSVNHYLATLRTILNEAERLGHIDKNPVRAVKNLVNDSKEKGILTVEEVKDIFDQSTPNDVWRDNRLQYLFNLVGASTGARLGEIQALKKEHLHRDHIHIRHSWDRKYGLKGTKTGKNRDIPINTGLYGKLASFAAERTADEFIFSAGDGSQPVDHKAIYKWYKRALNGIGISEEERRERNISFHSWRHFFNSRLRASGVPDSVIRSFTGHSDEKMTEHYSHFRARDYREVAEVMEGIL